MTTPTSPSKCDRRSCNQPARAGLKLCAEHYEQHKEMLGYLERSYARHGATREPYEPDHQPDDAHDPATWPDLEPLSGNLTRER